MLGLSDNAACGSLQNEDKQLSKTKDFSSLSIFFAVASGDKTVEKTD